MNKVYRWTPHSVHKCAIITPVTLANERACFIETLITKLKFKKSIKPYLNKIYQTLF